MPGHVFDTYQAESPIVPLPEPICQLSVNLLALRLQWFESTPAQGSPRAVLQVLKPLGGRFGISPLASDINPFQPIIKTHKRGKILTLIDTFFDTCLTLRKTPNSSRQLKFPARRIDEPFFKISWTNSKHREPRANAPRGYLRNCDVSGKWSPELSHLHQAKRSSV
jgi:hypothetical protein